MAAPDKKNTLALLLLFVSVALFALSNNLEGVSIEMLLFYANRQGGGGGGAVGENAVKSLVPAAVITAAVAAVMLAEPEEPVDITVGRRKLRLLPMRKHRKFLWPMSLSLLVLGAVLLSRTLGLPGYVWGMLHQTAIFESEYVDPAEQNISFPEEKRNLIYIYLESMETTCAGNEAGGDWEYDLIPGLTALAEENVSFSGFHQTVGTDWTSAGLVAQTSGLPLLLPLSEARQGEYDGFFPGAYTLGDILNEEGYNQTLLIGSEGQFGGRESYFTQHGGYEICDYNWAVETGKIPEDYRVFWGYEDAKLYDFAREKLLELAAEDEPFNLTLLTVDTHFPDGYLCVDCPDTYGTQYENVISCADSLVSEFVAWIQQQDFYENTTIVITGDHLYMEWDYFEDSGVSDDQRTIYNCFINSAAQPRDNGERTFTAVDMLPTVLTSLGAEWGSSRLGLGADLFSGEETLAERMGLKALGKEFRKHSLYYDRTFLYLK